MIDWYLPGTKAGGPIRSIYSLVTLLKDFFEITILTSNCDLGSDTPYPSIKSDVLFEEDGIRYFYFSKTNLNIDNVRKQIIAVSPDLIYLNSFWSFPFSIAIVKAQKKNLITVPVLLAPRGMLSKGALGLKSVKKILFLMIARLLGWYKRVIFHSTNEQETKDIRDHFKTNQIRSAPNINAGKVRSVIKNKTEKHLRLFYLSRIARVKNLHFALAVLNEIPSDLTVEYDIYGNMEDASYWSECEALIRKLPKNISVNLKGEIPFYKVQEVIMNYHALFLPTLNENYGHAIVESLLSGCPVLISDQTPWNDLEVMEAGFALPLHQKQKFIDAICALAILNQEDFNKKSQRAIDYISKKIDLEIILQQYKLLFNVTA